MIIDRRAANARVTCRVGQFGRMIALVLYRSVGQKWIPQQRLPDLEYRQAGSWPIDHVWCNSTWLRLG